MTDDGVLTFWATFSDGSEGIFTATIIPEPSALSLICVAAVLLSIGARRASRAFVPRCLGAFPPCPPDVRACPGVIP